MSLVARLPATSLYSAIFYACSGCSFDYEWLASRSLLDSLIIWDSLLVFQGEKNSWEGRDALIVTSESTDFFKVITTEVDVVQDGAFYYPRSRNIFRFIAKRNLLGKIITLNIQGIFSEEEFPADQLPISCPGLNQFSSLEGENTFLHDAKNIIFLERRIAEIDQENKENPPSTSDQYVKRYERDTTLVRLLKELRGNACQLCGYTFRKSDGEYYSECHHMDSLANGGLDVSKNMLILCANCHRRIHYAKISIIEHNIKEIIINMDGDIVKCKLSP
jgi:hypothetical protein